MNLKEQLKAIYAQKLKDFISVEDEANSFQEQYENIFINNKKVLENIDMEEIVDFVFNYLMDLKNIKTAIRIPLNLKMKQLKKVKTLDIKSAYSIIIPDDHITEISLLYPKNYNYPNFDLNNSKQLTLEKKLKVSDLLYTMKQNLFEEYCQSIVTELEKQYSEKMLEKVKSTGFKFKIREDKYKKYSWILFDIYGTKPDKVNENYREIYSKIMKDIYGE